MSVANDFRAPGRNQRVILLENVGAQTIPAHGVVEIVGSYRPNAGSGIAPANGLTVLQVRRPTKDGCCNVAIAGHKDIPTGKKLPGTTDYPAWVLYSGTPEAGEMWGTAKDSFSLARGRQGFVILGDKHVATSGLTDSPPFTATFGGAEIVRVARAERLFRVRATGEFQVGEDKIGILQAMDQAGNWNDTGTTVTVKDTQHYVYCLQDEEFMVECYGTEYQTFVPHGLWRHGKPQQAIASGASGTIDVETGPGCAGQAGGMVTGCVMPSWPDAETTNRVLAIYERGKPGEGGWKFYTPSAGATSIQGGICFEVTGPRTRLTVPNVHGTAPAEVRDYWGNVVAQGITAIGNQETVYFCETMWSAAVPGAHGLAIYNTDQGSWVVVACEVLAGWVYGGLTLSRTPGAPQEKLPIILFNNGWGSENDTVPAGIAGAGTPQLVEFLPGMWPHALEFGDVIASLDSIGDQGQPEYKVIYAEQMTTRARVVLQSEMCCGQMPDINNGIPPAGLDFSPFNLPPPQVGGNYQYGTVTNPRNHQAKANQAIWIEWSEAQAGGAVHINGWVVYAVEGTCLTVATNLRLVPAAAQGECDKIAYDEVSVRAEVCGDPTPREIPLGEVKTIVADVRDNGQDPCIKEKVRIDVCVRPPFGGFNEQVTPFLTPVEVEVLIPGTVINGQCLDFQKVTIKVYCPAGSPTIEKLCFPPCP